MHGAADGTDLDLPVASSTWTDPDLLEISASPVAPTVMRPLELEIAAPPDALVDFDAARHGAQISVGDRRHADRAALRRDADRAELTAQLDLPDTVPTMTSLPAGQRTSTASDGRPADLDRSVPRRLGDPTAVDDDVAA